MIQITRLDNARVVINSDLIETIEATPDTLLSMTTGRKVLVKESVAEVVERVVAFRRRVLCREAGAIAEEAQPPGHPGAP